MKVLSLSCVVKPNLDFWLLRIIFDSMRVGFYQFCPKLGDIDYNLGKIEEKLHSARRLDLMVLPELCNSGYNFKSKNEALELSEPVPGGRTVQNWIRICHQKKFYLAAGINECHNGKLYNSAVLVGPYGYLGKYRKLHLFYNEKKYFQPGNLGLPLFRVKGVKVGLLICYDWQFPEIWRIMALKGAQLICHPSNLVLPELSLRGLPGHAIVNRLYIITANRIGAERGLKFIGNSSIWNIRGEVMTRASQTREELRIVEIDPSLAKTKQITPLNNLYQDIRVKLSEKLLK